MIARSERVADTVRFPPDHVPNGFPPISQRDRARGTVPPNEPHAPRPTVRLTVSSSRRTVLPGRLRVGSLPAREVPFCAPEAVRQIQALSPLRRGFFCARLSYATGRAVSLVCPPGAPEPLGCRSSACSPRRATRDTRRSLTPTLAYGTISFASRVGLTPDANLPQGKVEPPERWDAG
jgi:hypothetical protein